MKTIETLYELAGSEIIDSRDLIARLGELEQQESLVLDNDARTEGLALDDYEREELTTLRALSDEGRSIFPDWTHGVSLVRDSYFTEYTQELAEDIGAIGPNRQWPFHYIDWDAAADALRMDFTSIEIEGSTYWGQ